MKMRRCSASLRVPISIIAIAACVCAVRSAPSAAVHAQHPFRILVTNDDGVRAPGILAVAQALQTLGEVTIAAPSENQSGKAQSIVTSDPIFVDQVTLAGGVRAYSIVATPATCVKVALHALMSERPDLVVSGINRGYNLGLVTYVSGTVGAAREGAMFGIPSIASSLAVEETDYAAAANIVRQVAERVRQQGLGAGVLLNVNVPAGPAASIKGIQITRQSAQYGTEHFEEQHSPSGRRLFWSVWKEPTGDTEGTDVWATEHGYAAVTPLRIGEFDQATYDSWRAGATPR